MSNCPSCGAPYRNGPCRYCGVTHVERERLALPPLGPGPTSPIAGLLTIPEEMTHDGDDDKFVQELLDHMTKPISDRSSASAPVPLLVRSESVGDVSVHYADLQEHHHGWLRRGTGSTGPR